MRDGDGAPASLLGISTRSVAASALLVFLIVVPLHDDVAVPAEPADAFEDDYAYWQALLKSRGLGMSESYVQTLHSAEAAAHVAEPVERTKITSVPRPIAGRRRKDKANQENDPVHSLQPTSKADAVCSEHDNAVPLSDDVAVPPAAPPLRSFAPSNARPAGPQLVKLTPPLPLPPQAARAPVTIQLSEGAISVRRRPHWMDVGPARSVSWGDPTAARAQADAATHVEDRRRMGRRSSRSIASRARSRSSRRLGLFLWHSHRRCRCQPWPWPQPCPSHLP